MPQTPNADALRALCLDHLSIQLDRMICECEQTAVVKDPGDLYEALYHCVYLVTDLIGNAVSFLSPIQQQAAPIAGAGTRSQHLDKPLYYKGTSR